MKISGEPARDGGPGHDLINAFAAQVGGTLERVPVKLGTTLPLVVPRPRG